MGGREKREEFLAKFLIRREWLSPFVKIEHRGTEATEKYLVI